MKTIGRNGIVMATLLSLLLAAGCMPGRSERTQGGDRDVAPGKKAESDKCLALDLGNGVTMKLVRIEAGTFMMGSRLSAEEVANRFGCDAKDYEHEHRQHQVTISTSFCMSATEVTQAQWKAVINTQPWEGKVLAKAGADNPVTYISWYDARAFCRALSEKSGRTVRLPTEAEWEYGCRAGTTTVYSFGDDASKLGEYAWWGGNTLGKRYAHPVGVKKPNLWGLHDMHGNVFEWCADSYDGSYARADARNTKALAFVERRILRGGSWNFEPGYCRTAYRTMFTPVMRESILGFRVVVEIGSSVD